MARVFVAGGTGAIGRPLIRQLVAAGHTVVAITRHPEKTREITAAGAEAVICDVFNRERLLRIVRDAAPDAIVHQLTDLPPTMNPRRLKDIYKRNDRVRREGTANLVAAARDVSVRRFVVQSMATWYRPGGSAVKSERDPLWTEAPEPIGEAVRTVVEMEKTVLQSAPIAIVLRYGAFYGPGTWYAADGEIARRTRKRAFPIVGSGGGVTSFVHVDDAASAVVSSLAAESSGVYNIVDDEPAPAAEWMPVYAKALGARPPWHVPEFVARLALGAPLTAWLTTMRGASNAEATTRLEWRPRYRTWREGFEKSLPAEDPVKRV